MIWGAFTILMALGIAGGLIVAKVISGYVRNMPRV